MKTLYSLKPLVILPVNLLIIALGATIALGWLATPGYTLPITTAIAPASLFSAQRSVPSLALVLRGTPRRLKSYEPPDNGGPAKTGGSGTR